MASWDTQRWYLPLLERTVTLPAEARVLEMGYYDPAGALWAAQHARHVVALRPAIDLVADLERGAREAGAANVEVRLATRLEPAEAGAFHAAFLLAPFFLGNAPVRAAIHTVTRALRPDGALYLQVHRRHGGATFLRYCEAVFDQVEALGIGGGQRRLYRASGPRAEAVPVDEPAAAAEAVQEVTLRGVSLRLRFAAGVFGARTVDPAARLLAERCQPRSLESMLQGVPFAFLPPPAEQLTSD